MSGHGPGDKAPATSASAGARTLGDLRLAKLRQRVIRDGFVSVAGTARELGVSEMTIGRDLARLEQQNIATRTHGGAIATGHAGYRAVDIEEPAFEARVRKDADAKAAIAAAAARITHPGQTVGLDVGTTTLQLAHTLHDHVDLKVFTNNIRAALSLSDSAHEVYVPGGHVRARENSIVGSIAVAQLRNYWLDHAFIGVSGLTEAGCFDYSLDENEIKRVFIERASNVVVLCDAGKFGRTSLVQVCELKEIDTLITDSAPPAALTEALRQSNVNVVVAAAPG